MIDETRPQPDAASGKGHILLVEDDKEFAEALGKILRNAGFAVRVATNSERRLRTWSRNARWTCCSPTS